MRKIVTVVGARPQFIKAAPVIRVLKKSIHEVIIHTGQHYDENMSRVFFDDLGLPRPDYNLEVGSGLHGHQTGSMLSKIEEVLLKERPGRVLVYGDTNSTLAGALAAVKLHIPIAHVEAGLRSFNHEMPEEINRILTDRCADLLFCPTETAVKNLKKEGIQEGVYHTGDVMYDAALLFASTAETRSSVLEVYQLASKKYCLCTIHRASNTDKKQNLQKIVKALTRIDAPVLFPVHPRARKFLSEYGLMQRLNQSGNVILTNPVSFLDMIQLEKNAKIILTDSGGVQKEAYFFNVPCVTLRNETEWVETIRDGWNILAGTDIKEILNAVDAPFPKTVKKNPFGDGHASEKISDIILARS
jgi:UDP-GlcNAc3NAcA epimerase